MNSENTVFSLLESLCTEPGYAHALSYLCFRHNFVFYSDKITPDHLTQDDARKRIIRTEISTLIGLLAKGPVEIEKPSSGQIQEHITRTQNLLEQLHECLTNEFVNIFNDTIKKSTTKDPLKSTALLREAMFYGPESAYTFQYRDFFVQKYINDEKWFSANIKLTINEIYTIIQSIARILFNNIEKQMLHLTKTVPENWTLLPAFIISPESINSYTNIDRNKILHFLEHFSTKRNNNVVFNGLSEFNHINAYPFIPIGNDQFLLFQIYNLYEALYETPFFEMVNDSAYKDEALKNRGLFLENFCFQRLEGIFGANNVFQNVILKNRKGETLAEIDILICFGDRLLIFQAKSKRLTIESRKGNESTIRSDFQKAVQDSYNQAKKCSDIIRKRSYHSATSGKTSIGNRLHYKKIYPICIVSDHYPALSYQSRQFLDFKTDNILSCPLVFDVFALDLICEFLSSPLYFISYIDRRSRLSENVMSSHEITILSYHLRRNLWVDNDINLVMLEDDISADLDVAISARREGYPGERTPKGILTKTKGTYFEKIISNIEHVNDPSSVSFGLALLAISEDCIDSLNTAIADRIEKHKNDGKNHDFSFVFGSDNFGITIHVNQYPKEVAKEYLDRHCQIAKYRHGAEHWYGICIEPNNLAIQCGIELDFPYVKSSALDKKLREAPSFGKLVDFRHGAEIIKRKIGRNEKCPCGSGKKYKHCCIGKFK